MREYRCICITRPGRACNRLLGKGDVAGFETVCPKCGATLLLTESGITIVQNALGTQWAVPAPLGKPAIPSPTMPIDYAQQKGQNKA